MPRRFINTDWAEPMQAYQQAGAIGGFANPQVIMPPGYNSNAADPFTRAFESISENFLQQAAQQRAMEQTRKAMEPLLPEFEKIGMSPEEINAYFSTGGKLPELVNKLFEAQKFGREKGVEYGHEEYTHQRDIAEKSFGPEAMDLADQVANGKLSYGNFMRQSGLNYQQAEEAVKASKAGQELQREPLTTQEKQIDVADKLLKLQGLPEKVKGEATKLQQEIKKNEIAIANARTPEQKTALEIEKATNTHKLNRLFDIHNPLPTKAGKRDLTPELQKVKDMLHNQDSPQSVYNSAKNNGITGIRPPLKGAVNPDTGRPIKGGAKPETLDHYLKYIDTVIQNRNKSEQTGSTATSGATAQYLPKAQQYGQKYGVDPNIIAGVMHGESGGNPTRWGDTDSSDPYFHKLIKNYKKETGNPGASFGLFQIFVPMHRDFDVERAKTDIDYQFDYAAKMMRGLTPGQVKGVFHGFNPGFRPFSNIAARSTSAPQPKGKKALREIWSQ